MRRGAQQAPAFCSQNSDVPPVPPVSGAAAAVVGRAPGRSVRPLGAVRRRPARARSVPPLVSSVVAAASVVVPSSVVAASSVRVVVGVSAESAEESAAARRRRAARPRAR